MLRNSININSQFVFIMYSLLFLALRLLWIKTNNLELYADEAQYWIWSKHLDWGYYSKPPFIAWVIATSSYFFGDSEFALRVFSPGIHVLIGYIIYLISSSSYDRAVGFFSGMLYITMPAVFASSGIISTDPILLLFWALAFYAFIRAIKSESIFWWILCGIFAGCGMLTKYSMLFFLLSSILYLYSLNKSLRFLYSKGFIIALIAAIIVFIPNLIWNINNGLVSILHTADLAEAKSYQKFSILKLLEFILAQFGVFGPITFSLLLFSIYLFLKKKINQDSVILCYFIVPILLIIILMAFVSRAHANWAVPAYIAAPILIVLIARSYNCFALIKVSIVLHTIIGLTMMFYQPILKGLGVELTAKTDIYKRLRGGSKLGEELIKFSELYPKAVIAIDTRKELALHTFYTRAKKLEIIKWNPSKEITDYFALTTDANKYIGRDMLIITEYVNEDHKNLLKEQLKQYADEVKFVGIIDAIIYNNYSLKEQVFYLGNFKGY